MRSSRPVSPTSASSHSRSRSKEGAIAAQLQYARDEAPDSDRLGVNFAGSLLLHGLVAAFIVGWAFFFHHRGSNWGENASSAGAIQATMVSSIPLPPTQRTLDTGVLTSEAPSPAPVTEKEKTEAAPTPDSIAIPDKTKPPKIADKPTPAPPKHIQPITPPPTKAVTGETAGIRIAQSTVEIKNGTASMSVQEQSFGDRYAWYKNLVTNKVAQNWLVGEADPRASMDKSTTILFEINRDGVPTNARVETRSGSPSLDTSALRAVQRVDGFGPLPLPSVDHITVEYTFHFRPQ
jgi:periplasmic protein TonB